MSVKKIGILGANGFIGSSLVNELKTSGQYTITRLPRLTSQVFKERGANLDELSGLDAVVNCAGKITKVKTPEAWFANALLPGKLLQACEQHGITRLVHLGSVAGSAYFDGTLEQAAAASERNFYGASKAYGELDLLDATTRSAVFAAILRPPAVYGFGAGGPTAMLVRAAKAGLPLPLGDFTAKRSYVSVTNLCWAIRELLALPDVTGPYFATDNDDYDVGEFYSSFLEAFGHRNRVFASPANFVGGIAKLVGGPFASLTTSERFDGSKLLEKLGQPMPMSLKDNAMQIASQFAGH